MLPKSEQHRFLNQRQGLHPSHGPLKKKWKVLGANDIGLQNRGHFTRFYRSPMTRAFSRIFAASSSARLNLSRISFRNRINF
jgi:hypothetical protein